MVCRNKINCNKKKKRKAKLREEIQVMRMVFPNFLELQYNIPKLRKTHSLPSQQPHHRDASGRLSPLPVLRVSHVQAQSLTPASRRQASRMPAGRLAELKPLLTQHVPGSISKSVCSNSSLHFHLLVLLLNTNQIPFSSSRSHKEPHQLPCPLLAQILVPVPVLARCLLLSVGEGSGPVLQMLLMQVLSSTLRFSHRSMLYCLKQRDKLEGQACSTGLLLLSHLHYTES